MLATIERNVPSPPSTELDNQWILTLSPRPQSEEIPARVRLRSTPLAAANPSQESTFLQHFAANPLWWMHKKLLTFRLSCQKTRPEQNGSLLFFWLLQGRFVRRVFFCPFNPNFASKTRSSGYFHTFRGTIGYQASATIFPNVGTTRKITQINENCE